MHVKRRQASSFALASLALLICTIPAAFAKGEGVGYWLEGTVASVHLSDNHVELVIAGRLTLDQYSGGPSTRQSIHYQCPNGIRASLTQWESFFAMTSDWRGGAIRGKGELGRLVQTALKRGSSLKLELLK